METLEREVKALHVALEQLQAVLTSPEVTRQSLKEQLLQRQVSVGPDARGAVGLSGGVTVGACLQRLLADMEGLKVQVQAVQRCQSTLQVPEDVMPSLAVCHTALRLQHEASQLQHVAIQQCNILQVR